jgi:hypothetical protein
MDRVRLGRVLGRGARMAARTAMEAVDAATSAEPVTPQNPVRRVSSAPTILPPQRTVRVDSIRVANAANAAAAAGAGVMAPLKKASRALWHELTGSFFALFALSFSVAAWRMRTAATAGDHNRFYAFCVLALLFAYFSVSSFVRARKQS